MNKDAKIEVLKALGKGKLSKVEAQKLIKANAKVIVSLSSDVQSPDTILFILDRHPEFRSYFQTIICLGNGKKPIF